MGKIRRRDFLKSGLSLAGIIALNSTSFLNHSDEIKQEVTPFKIKGMSKSGSASALGYVEVAKGEIDFRVKESGEYYSVRLQSWPKSNLIRHWYKDQFFIRAWGKLEGRTLFPKEYHMKTVEDFVNKPDLYTYSSHWYDYSKGEAITEFYQKMDAKGKRFNYGKYSARGIDERSKDYISALMELRFSKPESRTIIVPYNDILKGLDIKYLGKDTLKIGNDKYGCIRYYIELDEEYVGKEAPYKLSFYLHDADDRTPLGIFIDKKDNKAKAIYSGSKKDIENRKGLIPIC
ncbi:MAG: DUF3108 domain-containing protein [Candidatus Woesearchaeota archaeon]